MSLMGISYRPRTCTVLTAMLLLLWVVDSGPVNAGPIHGEGSVSVSGSVNSVKLSMKISAAKKRKRQVSFYKSVARQAKIRSTCGRIVPSER